MVLPEPAAQLTRDQALSERLAEQVTVAVGTDGTWNGPALDNIQVPGYEILAELGRGGMGVVYKARHLGLNRLVALKMILAGAHAGAAELARFRAEAEAVAQLEHPNIVQVHEIGTHGGISFLSLEFVGGGTLVQKLAGAPQKPDEAAAVVEALARAMHFAHERGIIHRDLKPANVLLATRESRVGSWQPAEDTGQAIPSSRNPKPEFRSPKITDFGLAKRVEGKSGLTQTGAIMGTPSYMAPEQASGGEVGPAVDVYALGAILYEMLTGRPPFQGPTAIDTIQQVLHREPVPPAQLQPNVPRDLETICLKCLHKDTARRYASAEALAEDLRRFRADEPILARRIGRAERAWRWCRRNPFLATASAVAAVALLAVVGLTFAFAMHQKQSAEDLRDEQRETQSALDEKKKALSEKVAQEKETQQQKALAEQRLADSYYDKAQAFGEQGDIRLGLHWLARALEIAPDNASDIRRAIRANVSHWSRELHSLQGMMSLPAAPRQALYSPDGKLILVADANNNSHVWDAVSGKQIAHLEKVRSGIFSADGKTLLVWEEKTARFWDAARRQYREPVLDHGAAILGGAMSDDGKLAATTGQNGVALLWDTTTGQRHGEALKHPNAATSPVFSKNNLLLFTGSVDGVVRRWETATGKQVVSGYISMGPIRQMQLSANEKWLLASGPYGTRLWELASGRILLSTPYQGSVPPQSVLSPDDRTLFVMTSLHSGQLYDLPDLRPRGTAMTHLGYIKAVSFSPDGRILATGSTDQSARLWNTSSAQQIGMALPHPGSVDVALYQPDGQTVFTACSSRQGKLWQPAPGHLIGEPLRHGWFVHALSFSKDGSRLLTGSADTTARWWDVKKQQPIGNPLKHEAQVLFASATPDSTAILTGCSNGTARLWNLRADPPRTRDFVHGGAIYSVALSSDGKLVLTGGTANGAQLWDATSGNKQGPPVRNEGSVYAVAFSPDGKRFAVGDNANQVQVFETDTRQPVGTPLRHQGTVWGLTFSADGKRLLSASEDRTAQLWNVETSLPVGGALPHKNPVKAVAFAPDGQTLATGDIDNLAQLWDTATGKRLGPALRHGGWVYSVAFSPDGRMFASGSGDSGVRFWEAPAPANGDSARITDWVALITGMTMDANGALQALDTTQWTALRERLDGRGGSPVPAVPELDAEVIARMRRAPAPPPEIPAPPPLAITLPQRRTATAEQIAQWIGQLNAPEERVRTAAGQALEDAGPAALGAVREAAPKLDAAHRKQVYGLLERLEIAAALEPRRVKLKLEKVGFERAIRELGEQGRIRFHLDVPPEKMPVVSIDFDGFPFWEALDQFCAQTGMAYFPSGADTFLVRPMPAAKLGGVAYCGPFGLDVANITQTRSQLFRAGTPVYERLTLNLRLSALRSTSVLRIGSPQLTEVLDENGQLLKPLLPAPPVVENRFASSQVYTLELQSAPERSKMLKRCRGIIPVEIAFKQQELVQIDRLAATAGRIVSLGDGMILTVEQIRLGPRPFLQLRIDDPFLMFSPDNYRFDLVDAQGIPMLVSGQALYPRPIRRPRPEHIALLGGVAPLPFPANVPWLSLQRTLSAGNRSEWGGGIDYYADAAGGQPVKLIITRFERKHVELGFELRDLPLP